MTDSVTISTGTITDTTIQINILTNITPAQFRSLEIYKDGNLVETRSSLNLNYTYTGLTANTLYYLYVVITYFDSARALNIKISSNIINPFTTCFVKDTKILKSDNFYIPIQNLQIGDIIKTLYGNKKIIGISHMKINCKIGKTNLIYKLAKDKESLLTEDLFVTGGHSILLDSLTDIQYDKMIKYWNPEENKINGKYKLLACEDDRFEISSSDDGHEIYHICLETNNIYEQFAIYANGILTETISIEYYNKVNQPIVF